MAADGDVAADPALVVLPDAAADRARRRARRPRSSVCSSPWWASTSVAPSPRTTRACRCCPKDARVDFLRRQVLMSRNIIGNRFTTFLMGGLNYQIEHHLFPSMPRPNLRRAQRIIQPVLRGHQGRLHRDHAASVIPDRHPVPERRRPARRRSVRVPAGRVAAMRPRTCTAHRAGSTNRRGDQRRRAEDQPAPGQQARAERDGRTQAEPPRSSRPSNDARAPSTNAISRRQQPRRRRRVTRQQRDRRDELDVAQPQRARRERGQPPRTAAVRTTATDTGDEHAARPGVEQPGAPTALR